MMKVAIENEGKQLVLKSETKLSLQEVFDAYRLIAEEAHDELLFAEATSIPVQLEEEDTNEEKKPRPKAVKMLNSERTLTMPLSELASLNLPEVVYVKAKVDCPVCSYQGDVTTRRGNSFCKCPNCESKLFNAYATGKQEEQDAEGYEFYANSEFKPGSKEDAK